MKLQTERRQESEIADEAELRTELLNLNVQRNTFAILSRADETYLQTAAMEDGFAIERREGSADTHVFASRPGVARLQAKKSRWKISAPLYNRYSIDETIRIFSAYLAGAPEPFPIIWVPLEGGLTPEERESGLRGLNIFFWFVVVVGIGIFLLWLMAEA